MMRTVKNPLAAFALFWPAVLIVPYLPGVPRPSLGGLSWRQELVFALLLTITFAVLRRHSGRPLETIIVRADRRTIVLVTCAILFTVWAVTSAIWSANPFSALQYAFQWIAYILFFIVIRTVAVRPRVLRGSLIALGSTIALLGIACLIESAVGAPLTDHSLRITSKPLLRGFSGFGETMAVAVPMFTALALQVRKRRSAAFCGATALIAWMATLEALERAPILGAAIGILVLTAGAITVQRFHPRNLSRAALLGLLFVVLTGFQLLPAGSGVNSVTPNALQRLQTTSVEDASTSARLLFWATGWQMFRAHPLIGVGANNYEDAFPEARADFAATHPNSPLVGMNEQLLTQYAHNEYIQILAELGLIGFTLFVAFCVVLTLTLWRSFKRAANPLLALGSGAGLLAFGVSSGASAFSFRWMGSGLMFFFAAALVSHLATSAGREVERTEKRAATASPRFGALSAYSGALALGLAAMILLWTTSQAMNNLLHAFAESGHGSTVRSEKLYKGALRFNPFDAATHYDYGTLLYQQNRLVEAIPHIKYAVDHGINTSTAYAYLAAAEEQAKNSSGSEETLAYATRVYPRSVFLLVRYAAALDRIGKNAKSEVVMSSALLIDSRAARGWYQLINFDIDAALAAANQDQGIAMPGELLPQNAVYVVLKENERRLNISPNTGWRGRVRSIDN